MNCDELWTVYPCNPIQLAFLAPQFYRKTENLSLSSHDFCPTQDRNSRRHVFAPGVFEGRFSAIAESGRDWLGLNKAQTIS